jgi:hypothetical protein
MVHIRRIDEMASQTPKASEVYDKVVKGCGPFELRAKRRSDNKLYGFYRFESAISDPIVDVTFDKRTDEIYSVVMYKNTYNPRNRDGKSIKDVRSRNADEVATEIIYYIKRGYC